MPGNYKAKMKGVNCEKMALPQSFAFCPLLGIGRGFTWVTAVGSVTPDSVADQQGQDCRQTKGEDYLQIPVRRTFLPGGQPAAKARLTLEPLQPTAANGGSIKLADGSRNLAHLPPSRRVVRIDLQDFKVRPDRIAQFSLPSQFIRTIQAVIQVTDIIHENRK